MFEGQLRQCGDIHLHSHLSPTPKEQNCHSTSDLYIVAAMFIRNSGLVKPISNLTPIAKEQNCPGTVTFI